MDYHAKPAGLKRWLTSTDHKEIGIMYILFAFVGLVVGGLLAMLVRWELWTAGPDVVTNQTYNAAFSVHAISMIFLFVMPIFAGFGNYIVPLQIGARDMAFPRINALGFWLLIPGALLIWLPLVFQILAPIPVIGDIIPPNIRPAAGGWTLYAPLSGNGCSILEGSTSCDVIVDAETGIRYVNRGTDFLIMGLHIVGISSILGAINFMVTIMKERRPDIGWHDISLFTWSIFTMAILLAFGTPSLTAGLTMLLMDRNFGTNFFVNAAGGDAIMWQHLFWFFGHPEVYILILPGMGMISEVLPRMARKPIFGYHAIAYSTLAIGVFGFLVWVHHMFTTGLDPLFRSFFMAMTFAIGVPTGVKIFNWLATLWNGQIQFKAPLLFAVGFLSMFVIGGINGVFTASIPIDYNLQDTYWVVSHLHYVLFGGSAMAIFAGTYYWFPRLSGRMYNETWARVHFALAMIGLNLVFFTMHFLGLEGMPRRYAEYDAYLQPMNQIASIGSYLLGLSTLVFFINLLWSMKKGPVAPFDPWRAGPKVLEWTTMRRAVPPATPMPYEVESGAGAEPSVKA